MDIPRQNEEHCLRTYSLKPEDLENGPDGEKTMVTDKAIRKYIVITIGDEYWDQADTDHLIIEDNNTWYSPQTFGSFGGEWHIDGPIIQITIDVSD
jgi:hypothetical protein